MPEALPVFQASHVICTEGLTADRWRAAGRCPTCYEWRDEYLRGIKIKVDVVERVVHASCCGQDQLLIIDADELAVDQRVTTGSRQLAPAES